VFGQIDAFARNVFRRHIGGRQHFNDRAAIDRDRMIFEHHAIGLDRHDPARGDQEIDGANMFGCILGHDDLLLLVIPAKAGIHLPVSNEPRPSPRRLIRDAIRCADLLRIDHLTLLTYSPVRVSTRITSSWFTNNGTRTVAPVSSLAGLPPPPEVSPRTPGSVSTIFSSTKLGGVTDKGMPFQNVTMHSSSPFSHCSASPTAFLSSVCCS